MTQTDYRETLLRETREELAKADGKASILLAASGIAFSALLTAGSTANWYPSRFSDDLARALAWTAIILTLLGIGVVGAAVKPRLRATRPRAGVPHYFADVEAYWPRPWQLRGRRKRMTAGRKDFADALAETAASAKDRSERLDDQIWHLSHIAYRKYRLVAIGMWLYALAALAAMVAVALEKKWL